MFSDPPLKTHPKSRPLKHLVLKVNKAYAHQTHQTIAYKEAVVNRHMKTFHSYFSRSQGREAGKDTIFKSFPESGPFTYFETCCLKVQVSNFTHISGLAALLLRNQGTGRHLLGHHLPIAKSKLAVSPWKEFGHISVAKLLKLPEQLIKKKK